jgi:transposase-like protein
MPAERTAMRHVREVLRLKFVGGVPTREIARRIGVAASTVRTTIKRFQAAGLSWPLPEELTDAALEARLFSDTGTRQGHRQQVEPDWASIHRKLKRKHVTLSILWDEYIEHNPQGYRYSRFCSPACAMPGCAIRPPSRMSITAPRAASTAHCSKSSPKAAGSMRTRT